MAVVLSRWTSSASGTSSGNSPAQLTMNSSASTSRSRSMNGEGSIELNNWPSSRTWTSMTPLPGGMSSPTAVRGFDGMLDLESDARILSGSPAKRPAVLERHQPVAEGAPRVAVKAQVNEPGRAEEPHVRGPVPGHEAHVVAHRVILDREQLEEGDASEQTLDRAQTGARLGERKVVEHVRADDEIEAPLESQAGHFAEAAAADVAATAIAPDDVGARIDSEVAEVRPGAQQQRAPAPFAAPDVEYRANRALEQVLGGGDREPDTPRERARMRERIPRLAVPVVEVPAVVSLAVPAAGSRVLLHRSRRPRAALSCERRAASARAASSAVGPRVTRSICRIAPKW